MPGLLRRTRQLTAAACSEEFWKDAPLNDASYDAVRQSVVVLMGSLAKHLDKSDPKVKPIACHRCPFHPLPAGMTPTTWALFGWRWKLQTESGCQIRMAVLSALLSGDCLVYSELGMPLVESHCYYVLDLLSMCIFSNTF